jgi:hypothetical protein
MHFAMAARGSVFSTPERAIRILAELEQAEAGSSDLELVIDFAAVSNVSDSFANAFIGTVVSRRRSLGLPDPAIISPSPFVEKVINRMLQLRGLGDFDFGLKRDIPDLRAAA